MEELEEEVRPLVKTRVLQSDVNCIRSQEAGY
jgi:hypothetical protein